jgi:hypothetical protein
MQPTRSPFVLAVGALVSVSTVLALVFGSLVLGGPGRADAQAAPTPAATAAPVAPPAQPAVPGVDAQPFARTELYFGSERPGPDVSRRDFAQFLDAEITPRFPDGLTLLSGRGQFRESDGTIVEETSFVLILFYPYEDRAESSALVEEIRRRYIEQFDQESVLRVDDPRPVLVGF